MIGSFEDLARLFGDMQKRIDGLEAKVASLSSTIDKNTDVFNKHCHHGNVHRGDGEYHNSGVVTGEPIDGSFSYGCTKPVHMVEASPPPPPPPEPASEEVDYDDYFDRPILRVKPPTARSIRRAIVKEQDRVKGLVEVAMEIIATNTIPGPERLKNTTRPRKKR